MGISRPGIFMEMAVTKIRFLPCVDACAYAERQIAVESSEQPSKVWKSGPRKAVYIIFKPVPNDDFVTVRTLQLFTVHIEQYLLLPQSGNEPRRFIFHSAMPATAKTVDEVGWCFKFHPLSNSIFGGCGYDIRGKDAHDPRALSKRGLFKDAAFLPGRRFFLSMPSEIWSYMDRIESKILCRG